MSYGQLNIDLITGSGAGSVIINNGTSNVLGVTTGNNLQMLQNGGGIVFNNSSASVNSTLNDYEAGTWTPTVTANGGGSPTYTSGGTYTKIGRSVVVQGYFNLTNTSGSGYAVVSSFPFTVLANATVSTNFIGVARENSTTGYLFQTAMSQNTSNMIIWTTTNGGITWTNGYSYCFSITYETQF